ncbi:2Fe-2S iron-sulfur cluster-binding protein [Solimonas marina]|uniref:2Fe-2S iron-sulfur cluster binding domain-containing protein n=1 Tax=Solimonas marina TaxID=2714601 RepID=A0A969W9S1_9GAMM|nr:2Fe-2S iron-sulfur cluster-binding protein [Solimonas marina]NKF20955.1 2Fe-2S iron-sulfur cluster binding domain-containing protein [Solimonas marina]
MPKIVFIQPDGVSRSIDADAGQNLMDIATNHLVSGIVGDCGGCCSCATCHVYVDDAWAAKLVPADEMEQAMLEGVIDPQTGSRLGCQIQLSDALDGLVVRMPARQF